MATALRSSNPTLNESVFRDAREDGSDFTPANVMTLGGTAGKGLILLTILMTTAIIAWTQVLVPGGPGGARFAVGPNIFNYIGVGLVGALILGLVIYFKPQWSPVIAPLYAALEGLFLGAISAIFEMRYPGIVMEAFGLTMGVAAAMFGLYATGMVQVTQRFKAVVMAMVFGIMLVYLISAIGMFGFGWRMPYLYDASPIGIGISLVIVLVASLCLMLDFEMISEGVASGAPKYMEWYGAYALMVTLVWLYIEMLKLLAKIRSYAGDD